MKKKAKICISAEALKQLNMVDVFRLITGETSPSKAFVRLSQFSGKSKGVNNEEGIN